MGNILCSLVLYKCHVVKRLVGVTITRETHFTKPNDKVWGQRKTGSSMMLLWLCCPKLLTRGSTQFVVPVTSTVFRGPWRKMAIWYHPSRAQHIFSFSRLTERKTTSSPGSVSFGSNIESIGLKWRLYRPVRLGFSTQQECSLSSMRLTRLMVTSH